MPTSEWPPRPLLLYPRRIRPYTRHIWTALSAPAAELHVGARLSAATAALPRLEKRPAKKADNGLPTRQGVRDVADEQRLQTAELRPEARLGNELRRAREGRGVSLRALARKLYRSHSTLVEYERGHRLAPLDVVEAYC